MASEQDRLAMAAYEADYEDMRQPGRARRGVAHTWDHVTNEEKARYRAIAAGVSKALAREALEECVKSASLHTRLLFDATHF